MAASGSTYVYIIAKQIDDGYQSPCKIGISDRPRDRLSSLQSGNHARLAIVHLFALPSRQFAALVEKGVLASKKAVRLHGEWLDLDPLVALQLAGLYIIAAMHSSGLVDEALYDTARAAGAWPTANGMPLLPNAGVLS